MAVTVVVSLLAAESVSAQPCVPVPAGIVGWWSGNETANDAVAGNHGQLFGDATFGAAMVGAGFLLDGFGDYVEIPDTDVLRPLNVSVEAWARFDSLDTPIVSQFGAPGQQYIVFKKNSRVFNFEGYSLHKARVAGIDRLVFEARTEFGAGAAAISNTQVVTGQFYHVVGTFDGSRIRIYVDGVLEADVANPIVLNYGTRPVFVGTSGETVFDGKLHGLVDEASIYSRALGDDEVYELFAAGSGGKCSSAAGQLLALANLVQTLNLAQGISNSLDTKLQTAFEALDRERAGDRQSACGRLSAFLNEVAAQKGKALTASQAEQLTMAATRVRAALQCP